MSIGSEMSLIQASAAAPAVPPTRHRFCGRCGAARPADATDCPACRHADSRRAACASQEIGVSHVLLLYASLLITLLLNAILAVVINSANHLWIEIIFISMESLLVLAFAIKARRSLYRLLRPPANRNWLLAALPLGVMTCAVAYGVTTGLHDVLHVPLLRYTDTYFAQGWSTTTVWIVAMSLVALQPAIIEEIAFRGVVLTGLKTSLSTAEAIVVGAAMFAILHLSVLSLPHLVLLGLVAGWMRFGSGSLWPGMLVHFCHNATCVLIELFGR